MKNKKNELVLSAITLVRVGETLEEAKGKLKQLVDQGVPYESEEMKKASRLARIFCYASR